MCAREDHSVFEEPHNRPVPGKADSSEEKARRILNREATNSEANDAGRESVFDEPDILPGRQAEVVDQDWSCSSCGYNLRGLPSGHPCPECRHVELYRPPPPDAQGYASRFAKHAASTSLLAGWRVALACALAGGLFAVFGAMLESAPGGLSSATLLVAVVFGPTVEETMKIAAAAIVVEVRPWLFARVAQVRLAALGCAAVFAAIENVLYLNVFVPAPSDALILWRWTVCVALHVGCTAVATKGLAGVWQRTHTERRPPRLTDGGPMLTLAIVIHAAYNATMIAGESNGWLPF